MAFGTNYVVGGELDRVKKINYIERIKNFANLNVPYNKMNMYNVPAIAGVYDFEYITPAVDLELVSLVITCSGYGENDYYNIYVNDELWFDTWFPTEVKEGLFIGTSTYVVLLPPQTKFRIEFFNMNGTSKKVWAGFRFLSEKAVVSQTQGPIIDVNQPQIPTRQLDNNVIKNNEL